MTGHASEGIDLLLDIRSEVDHSPFVWASNGVYEAVKEVLAIIDSHLEEGYAWNRE